MSAPVPASTKANIASRPHTSSAATLSKPTKRSSTPSISGSINFDSDSDSGARKPPVASAAGRAVRRSDASDISGSINFSDNGSINVVAKPGPVSSRTGVQPGAVKQTAGRVMRQSEASDVSGSINFSDDGSINVLAKPVTARSQVMTKPATGRAMRRSETSDISGSINFSDDGSINVVAKPAGGRSQVVANSVAPRAMRHSEASDISGSINFSDDGSIEVVAKPVASGSHTVAKAATARVMRRSETPDVSGSINFSDDSSIDGGTKPAAVRNQAVTKPTVTQTKGRQASDSFSLSGSLDFDSDEGSADAKLKGPPKLAQKAAVSAKAPTPQKISPTVMSGSFDYGSDEGPKARVTQDDTISISGSFDLGSEEFNTSAQPKARDAYASADYESENVRGGQSRVHAPIGVKVSAAQSKVPNRRISDMSTPSLSTLSSSSKDSQQAQAPARPAVAQQLPGSAVATKPAAAQKAAAWGNSSTPSLSPTVSMSDFEDGHSLAAAPKALGHSGPAPRVAGPPRVLQSLDSISRGSDDAGEGVVKDWELVHARSLSGRRRASSGGGSEHGSHVSSASSMDELLAGRPAGAVRVEEQGGKAGARWGMAAGMVTALQGTSSSWEDGDQTQTSENQSSYENLLDKLPVIKMGVSDSSSGDESRGEIRRFGNGSDHSNQSVKQERSTWAGSNGSDDGRTSRKGSVGDGVGKMSSGEGTASVPRQGRKGKSGDSSSSIGSQPSSERSSSGRRGVQTRTHALQESAESGFMSSLSSSMTLSNSELPSDEFPKGTAARDKLAAGTHAAITGPKGGVSTAVGVSVSSDLSILQAANSSRGSSESGMSHKGGGGAYSQAMNRVPDELRGMQTVKSRGGSSSSSRSSHTGGSSRSRRGVGGIYDQGEREVADELRGMQAVTVRGGSSGSSISGMSGSGQSRRGIHRLNDQRENDIADKLRGLQAVKVTGGSSSSSFSSRRRSSRNSDRNRLESGGHQEHQGFQDPTDLLSGLEQVRDDSSESSAAQSWHMTAAEAGAAGSQPAAADDSDRISSLSSSTDHHRITHSSAFEPDSPVRSSSEQNHPASGYQQPASARGDGYTGADRAQGDEYGQQQYRGAAAQLPVLVQSRAAAAESHVAGSSGSIRSVSDESINEDYHRSSFGGHSSIYASDMYGQPEHAAARTLPYGLPPDLHLPDDSTMRSTESLTSPDMTSSGVLTRDERQPSPLRRVGGNLYDSRLSIHQPASGDAFSQSMEGPPMPSWSLNARPWGAPETHHRPGGYGPEGTSMEESNGSDSIPVEYVRSTPVMMSREQPPAFVPAAPVMGSFGRSSVPGLIQQGSIKPISAVPRPPSTVSTEESEELKSVVEIVDLSPPARRRHAERRTVALQVGSGLDAATQVMFDQEFERLVDAPGYMAEPPATGPLENQGRPLSGSPAHPSTHHSVGASLSPYQHLSHPSPSPLSGLPAAGFGGWGVLSAAFQSMKTASLLQQLEAALPQLHAISALAAGGQVSFPMAPTEVDHKTQAPWSPGLPSEFEVISVHKPITPFSVPTASESTESKAQPHSNSTPDTLGTPRGSLTRRRRSSSGTGEKLPRRSSLGMHSQLQSSSTIPGHHYSPATPTASRTHGGSQLMAQNSGLAASSIAESYADSFESEDDYSDDFEDGNDPESSGAIRDLTASRGNVSHRSMMFSSIAEEEAHQSDRDELSSVPEEIASEIQTNSSISEEMVMQTPPRTTFSGVETSGMRSANYSGSHFEDAMLQTASSIPDEVHSRSRLGSFVEGQFRTSRTRSFGLPAIQTRSNRISFTNDLGSATSPRIFGGVISPLRSHSFLRGRETMPGSAELHTMVPLTADGYLESARSYSEDFESGGTSQLHASSSRRLSHTGHTTEQPIPNPTPPTPLPAKSPPDQPAVALLLNNLPPPISVTPASAVAAAQQLLTLAAALTQPPSPPQPTPQPPPHGFYPPNPMPPSFWPYNLLAMSMPSFSSYGPYAPSVYSPYINNVGTSPSPQDRSPPGGSPYPPPPIHAWGPNPPSPTPAAPPSYIPSTPYPQRPSPVSPAMNTLSRYAEYLQDAAAKSGVPGVQAAKLAALRQDLMAQGIAGAQTVGVEDMVHEAGADDTFRRQLQLLKGRLTYLRAAPPALPTKSSVSHTVLLQHGGKNKSPTLTHMRMEVGSRYHYTTLEDTMAAIAAATRSVAYQSMVSRFKEQYCSL